MHICNLPVLKLNNNNFIHQREISFGVSCLNFTPLKQDTFSFRGTPVKKSDFKGMDLYVLEKHRYDVQTFKSKDDLQSVVGEEIEELKTKDYGGRQEETKIQRKAMLKEWFDYVTKENDAYSNTQRLVILSAITKDLKPDNDNIPPVLNKGVLADTVEEVEKNLKTNPKEKFNFYKLYQNNLRKDVLEDTNTGETETKWVVIPSKEHDSENFEKNVDKLKLLSHKTWCTKSFNAKPHLSKGDFHVYLENGQPKLGVRFEGDKVVEIQGEKNNSKIPLKYLDVFQEYIKDNKLELNNKAKKELKNAISSQEKVTQIKKDLGEAIHLETIDDVEKVLNKLDVETKKTKEGLELKEFEPYFMGVDFDDLDINQNKLFKFITRINEDADFSNSQITNLGNLKYIGGKADFLNSQITDLGELQYIGGNADFEGSQIKSLKNLETINGQAYFDNSKVMDLGKLKTIGEYATFENSQITSLGNLKTIRGIASFANSQILSLGDLETIGESAYFRNSKVTDLGKLKTIGENVTFENSQVKSLGNLKSIGGNADFSNSQITSLGNLQTIGGYADFSYTQIKDLGKLQSIGGYAYFPYSKITNLGNLQSIGGKAYFPYSKITNLGKLKFIGGDARFNNSLVTSLGNLEHVGGAVFLTGSQVKNYGKLNLDECQVL